LITYHRTDSTRVSSEGIRVARSFIEEELSANLFRPRTYKGEGAHECIRPTRSVDARRLARMIREGIITPAKALTKDHLKLYDLIFRRFIASQMKNAAVRTQKALLNVSEREIKVEGVVEVIDKGWISYAFSRPKIVQELKGGEKLKVVKLRKFRAATVLPFTEGEIVATMKQRGIGRPSTYAKIVSTLFERKYVFTSRKKFVFPTRLGKVVYSYLTNRFADLVSEEKTRELEMEMLAVERGDANYQEILKFIWRDLIESGVIKGKSSQRLIGGEKRTSLGP